jgi:hypothetical protein
LSIQSGNPTNSDIAVKWMGTVQQDTLLHAVGERKYGAVAEVKVTFVLR